MVASGRRVSAAQATLALTAVLAGAATLLVVAGEPGPVVVLALPTPVIILGLIVMFFGGEQVLLNVEFRRQAHSLTLAGVPLALAVLVAPAHTVVLVRVIGAGLALVWQRPGWDKVLYNVAAYGFEIAFVAMGARVAVGQHAHLDIRTFLIVLAVLVSVDQAMSCLVLGIIRLHNGPLTRADIAEVLMPAMALSLVTSAFATATVVLVDFGGGLGVVLVIVVAAVAGVAYRGYAATTRRHQNLELMHGFVAGGVGAESVAILTEELLVRIRTLMNAGGAALCLFEGETLLRYGVSEDDRLATSDEPLDPTDWVTIRVRSEHEPVLLPRDSKDRGVRSWLASRGLRDAVFVPLPAAQDGGVVVVFNRLGEIATFTDDDLSLLQTLTGHLAVALQGTRLVEKLSYDASHDSLTGLHNRAYLTRHIQDTVTASTASAVLLLDLDGFKEVNDTLGHDTGDRLLQIAAQRLVLATPTAATVVRLGGDEFAILLPAVTGGAEEALTVASVIADALAQPVLLNEARLDIKASVGVALSDTEGHAADLLRRADTAMYSAKTGRTSIALYDDTMDQARLERLELLADLRTALRTDPDQFLIYYQPKTDLNTGAVVSTEALVRWQHPRLGFIGPDLFIPLAEATGLIDELTPLVLDTALADCAAWIADGHEVSVAVNLSAHNVEDPLLPDRVSDALRRHGVDAAKLILEITESSVMGDPQQTMPVLHRLHALGITLSLDDFGTGYSSLSYLQKLPVQEVKIDRSFVVGLESEQDSVNSRALIQSITGLSRNLGLRVVAEGIEDQQRLSELRELGCDIAQGYYISRPLPAEQLHTWLAHYEPQIVAGLRLVSSV